MAVIKLTKILATFVMSRKTFGVKKSILLGISLVVKFSTSIVIIKVLYDKGLISSEVFSIFIGTKILFKFIVPFLLSTLITKWNLKFEKAKGALVHDG
jgi:hypothetical protein